jgi:hypothetical protein
MPAKSTRKTSRKQSASETSEKSKAKKSNTSTPETGSSPEASPVKIFPKLENEGDSMLTGQVFGGKCGELLGSYDRDTQSLKMCLPCVVRGLTVCYVVLPRSGMMQNGKFYRRERQALPTNGNESGLLPTPTVMDAEIGLIHETRTKQMWEEVSNLTEAIKAIHLGLTGHQSPPPELYILNPSFVEWIMGYPPGWTELEG